MTGKRTNQHLKIVIVLFLTLFFITKFQATSFATQLIFNGDFESDISAWQLQTIEKGVKTSWDKAGDPKPGSIKFSATGRMQNGENKATQQIVKHIKAGSSGSLRFSWKKNWSSILPEKQHVYISLIMPDKSIVPVWADQKLSNDNGWLLENLDVSKYLNQTGKYSIVLNSIIENGNSRHAITSIWIDNLKLNIGSNLNDGPQTSIFSPTGASPLAGEFTTISGIASCDTAIKFVEVSIERYDHTWWNGDSWVRDRFWNPTRISSGKKTRSVAWSFPWHLPTSDGAKFLIRARATDIIGNQEAIPIEYPVKIDNVASIGSILINNGAQGTSSQQVIIKNVAKGAVQMQFSVDEGRTWSPWKRFTPAASITLPEGDGMKTVSAQFYDGGGNIFKTSDMIMLDTVPPVARTIFPVENAIKVLTTIKVGVVFYEDMDGDSFKNNGSPLGSTVYITQGSRWVPAYAIYAPETKSLRLTPTMQLDPGSSYVVHLTRGIKDVAGNPLAADFTWKFTTGGAFVAVRTTPIDSGGGNITSRNEIATLNIPAGALDIDTNITMEELKDEDIPSMHNAIRYSPVYRLTPAQQAFNKPATIKIKYEQNQVPDPTDLIIAYYDELQKTWLPFPKATINLVDHEIVAPMSGLGTVTILSQTDPEPPSTSIVEPTGLKPIEGDIARIYGVSSDNVGVSEVEISITRKSNDSYWNGKKWVEEETWIPLKIANGVNGKNASWFYAWKLPPGLRDTYRIDARSRDVSGNLGPNAGAASVVLANAEY